MSMMKKAVLASLLALSPMFAHASGISFYLVSNSSVQDVTQETATVDDEYEQDIIASGLGLAFKSHVTQDKMYAYHLNLEYLSGEVDAIDGASTSGYPMQRWNMLHTFAFGLVKQANLRIWAGPRITLSLEHTEDDYSADTWDTFGIGVGPAVGAAVTLNRKLGLFIDMDHRFGSAAGSWDDGITDRDYTLSEQGFSLRLGMNIIFGERGR